LSISRSSLFTSADALPFSMMTLFIAATVSAYLSATAFSKAALFSWIFAANTAVVSSILVWYALSALDFFVSSSFIASCHCWMTDCSPVIQPVEKDAPVRAAIFSAFSRILALVSFCLFIAAFQSLSVCDFWVLSCSTREVF